MTGSGPNTTARCRIPAGVTPSGVSRASRASTRKLDIRPLSEAARERYMEEWRGIEARFVNDPEDSAKAAERVVLRALEERGYPTGNDAEERAAHLAVDHPEVVERYRHGRAMLGEVKGREGTENLRRAMLDFRAVFEEVVERERTAA